MAKTDQNPKPRNIISDSEYYDEPKKKVGDVIIGFFGIIIINVTIYFLSISTRILNFLIILNFISYIAGFIYFKKIGREYISLGMALTFLIPLILFLLIFGACIIGLSGWH